MTQKATARLDADNEARAWYALRVKHPLERGVALALASIGIETFLPTYRVESRWSDRTKFLVRLLLPGYVFASFRLSELPAVCHVQGVLGVLPNSFRPVSIPDSQIDAVKRTVLVLASPELARGDAITVTSGPWRGRNGAVSRLGHGGRVTILLGSLRVEFPASSIRLGA